MLPEFDTKLKNEFLTSQSAPRVKFAPDTQQGNATVKAAQQQKVMSNSLQRSKSLSSADALARGMSSLGLGVLADSGAGNDIGPFNADIQATIDQALKDPNQLSSRSLMDLANQIMQRAVEGRR